jgi:flagellar biosynthesis/type III secretory pathway chaperone
MTTTAVRDHQSSLEAALVDVHTTLADLLVAADEQYAAVVARDHERLESVTRQQERLSARLARAEARRLDVLAGTPLADAIAALPGEQASRAAVLRDAIATAVRDLKARQSHTAGLLARSIELTKQTLDFVQRLVMSPSPAYDARGASTMRQSILVDGRA